MTISITAPAQSYKLTTVADFKALVGITTTDDNALISTIIDRVSAQTVAYCNQNFAKQTYTETMSGSGGKNLMVTNTPIVSITSVTYDGTVVDPSLYTIQEPEIGLIRSTTRWNYTYGDYLYSVVYVAGYVLPSFTSGTVNLPLDIQAAALEMAKSMYNSRDEDSSLFSESVPDVYEAQYGGSSGSSTGIKSSPLLNGLATIGNHRRFNI